MVYNDASSGDNLNIIYLSSGVPPNIIKKILDTILEIRHRFGASNQYLEIYIYSDVDEYRLKSGVLHPEVYFIMHEAHHGWPRIHVIYDLLKELDEDVWIAGVIHETIHSIIHGSLKYYIFTPPEPYISICLKYVGRRYCSLLFDILSSAAKDYEVSVAALENGITDRYLPLLEYFLDDICRDLELEYISIEEKLIVLANTVKQLSAAYPYKSNIKISRRIDRILSLARREMGVSLEGVEHILSGFGGDTYSNIIKLSIYFMENVFNSLSGLSGDRLSSSR